MTPLQGDTGEAEAQVIESQELARHALALTPTKAEELLAAMERVVKASTDLQKKDKARFLTYTNKEAGILAERAYEKAVEELDDSLAALKEAKKVEPA